MLEGMEAWCSDWHYLYIDVNGHGLLPVEAENQGKLKSVPIIEKAGKAGVKPSMDTVLDGSYQPLSRPIFIYVNARSLAKPEVKKFVDFYMAQGAALAKEVERIGNRIGIQRRQAIQQTLIDHGKAPVVTEAPSVSETI